MLWMRLFLNHLKTTRPIGFKFTGLNYTPRSNICLLSYLNSRHVLHGDC